MRVARVFVMSLSILAWHVAVPPGTARAQGEEAQGDAAASETLSPREARRKARALERDFQRLFREEKFDEAAAMLEEIVRLDPQDLHLYNLALIQYHRGDKEKAMEAFQRFLDAKPRDRGLVREAQRFVRILERDVRIIQEARRQSQSQIAEAERMVAEARARADEAESARAAAEGEAEAARQAAAEKEAERARLHQIVMSTPSGAGAGKRTLGVSLAVAGGLALGIGAFYGIDAMNASREAESVEQWTVGHDWLIERAESYEKRSLVFAIAGAGMLAAGATFYYLGEREARQPLAERMELGIAPAVTPDGAGVSLLGHF